MRVVASGRCIPRVTCSGKTNYGTCDEYEKRWLVSELEILIETEPFRMVRQKQELAAKSSSKRISGINGSKSKSPRSSRELIILLKGWLMPAVLL